MRDLKRFPEVRVAEGGTLFSSSSFDFLRVMDLQQEQLARSLGDGHRVIHARGGLRQDHDPGCTRAVASRPTPLSDAETSPGSWPRSLTVGSHSCWRRRVFGPDADIELTPCVTSQSWCGQDFQRPSMGQRNSGKWGCGQKLGLPGGSSCIRTRTGFER